MKKRKESSKYKETRWIMVTPDVIEFFFGDSYPQPMEAIELLSNGRYNLYTITGPIRRSSSGKPVAVKMLDKDYNEMYYYFDAWKSTDSEVFLSVCVPNESFYHWT